MQDILYLCEAKDYKVYLTGRDNFRKELYPEYKANRKDKPKPKYLQDIREFLVQQWFAQVTSGCEADDYLGVNQTNETIICTIDKDLLQVPGRHFNWVTGEFLDQTEFGGLQRFYMQLLQGDRGDNIPGVDGIGPKKSHRFLEGCETEQELFDICLKLYDKDVDRMVRNGKLLWIWRTIGGTWEPKNLLTGSNLLKQEEVVKCDSTTQNLEVTIQSTELTDPEINGL